MKIILKPGDDRLGYPGSAGTVWPKTDILGNPYTKPAPIVRSWDSGHLVVIPVNCPEIEIELQLEDDSDESSSRKSKGRRKLKDKDKEDTVSDEATFGLDSDTADQLGG
ncbi:hypothetical protein GF380_01500 [Candidatus Uhrbacteria bacterium]|nr:hypothetical protein [Candidatus Uhrbacteria bacterium]